MSQGIQLISSVIAARSHTAMRMVRPEHFTPEERPAFEFVNNFYRQFGELPTREACNENGISLMIAPNPVAYYIDRVRKRNIGTSWQEDMPNLVRGMQQADVDATQLVLERMVRTGRAFNNNGNQVVSLEDAMEQVREDYLYASQLDEGALRGVTFGWDYLDQITQGATGGDVSVFVARPGLGKSWTMIFNALRAWQAGHSVLFVTMEMTVLQTARRMLAMMTGIRPNAIRRGRLSHWAEDIFYETIDDGLGGPAFHFVAGDLNKSVTDVDNLVAEFTPDLVIVDAAYLLDPEKREGKFSKYAKHEALQDVLKGIKDCALRRDVPINISVQFNRDASKSKAGGGLENIFGSDWIGQIASNVIGIGPGEEANFRTQRVYDVLKVRDGENGAKFVTNFLFAPFDMSFIRAITEQDQTNRHQQIAQQNQSMI